MKRYTFYNDKAPWFSIQMLVDIRDDHARAYYLNELQKKYSRELACEVKYMPTETYEVYSNMKYAIGNNTLN